MVFGRRPEYVLLQPITGQNQNVIACMVTMVEFLGDRTDVYLESSSCDRLIAKVDPNTDINVGQSITVYIDVEKVHIFEPGEKGKNIGLPSY